MTYPPQPGQPYGQHPQGQQPGGYPQQPYPQQGGWNPNNPGYTQGFGGPPTPPPKSKTGLIIGIVIGVVVLIAFGITGFVAPGFLLSEASSSSAPKSSTKPSSLPTTESTEGRGSGPKGDPKGDPKGIQVIKDFFAKASSGDKAGALALGCEKDKPSLSQSIDAMIPSGSKIEVNTTTGLTKDIVSGDLVGTSDGREVTGLSMAKTGNPDKSFCLTSFFVYK